MLGCWTLYAPALANAQQGEPTELIEKARELGVDQNALNDLQSRAELRGINNQDFITILNSVVTLAQQQLPSDHIVKKALEGMSKGVPGTRLVSVLGNLERATQESAEIVKPWVRSSGVRAMLDRTGDGQSEAQFEGELIKSASKAVSQNTPAAVIGEILSDINDASVLSEAHPSNIVTAVSVMPDLPTSATQPEVSRAFIVRALKGGFGAADFQKLPTALNIAQMRSQVPASSVLKGVSDQLQGGIPATQILQNLFDGNIGGGPSGNRPPGLGNKGRQGQGNN